MSQMKSRLLASLLGGVLCSPLAAQATQLISVNSSGVSGGGGSYGSAVSADARYVAFLSGAADLVAGDTNGFTDAFVRDRQSGTTQRVSVASGGAEADGASDVSVSISSDGRYVAFYCEATNLVPGDTNGVRDCFVHDRSSGTTERVSVATGGTEGDAYSGLILGSAPSVSPDGRFVAFNSFATNLVASDTNGSFDVFLRDRQNGTTERVSVATGGAEGGASSFSSSITPDGRFVVFVSEAANLVSGDTNALHDVFLRDRQSGTTERVNVATGGAQATGGTSPSVVSSLTPDGRFVAFLSGATNLVAGDTNGRDDVFVRDRHADTTGRVSVATGGAEGNFASGYPSISADGRFVAFISGATTLVAGDTNMLVDTFVRDRQNGTTERVSVATDGTQSRGTSSLINAPTSVSADGRFVVFITYAPNLVAGDTNGIYDVFLRDRLGLSGAPMVQSCFPGTGGVIACPCGQPANPAGGCANFGAGSTSGAVLNASGTASVSSDTVLLTTSNHRSPPGGVLNVFYSYKPGGPAPTSGIGSGAGVRCAVGGSLKRLYTVQAFGGSISKPGMGDLSVSAQSATFPGHAIVPPESRHYLTVYRDGQAGVPCGNPLTSTNVTNMGVILWVP
ncbi:MAG: TolB family protein [Planctomycetota bacterium]